MKLCVSGDMEGRAFKHGTGLRAESMGEIPSLDDSAAKVELFLFQGQKGDPGLSPGKAHDGTKVGFQGPQRSGQPGSGQQGNHQDLGRASLREATVRQSQGGGKVWKGQYMVWFVSLKISHLSLHQTQSLFLLSSSEAATNKTDRFCLWAYSWGMSFCLIPCVAVCRACSMTLDILKLLGSTCPGSFQRIFKVSSEVVNSRRQVCKFLGGRKGTGQRFRAL